LTDAYQLDSEDHISEGLRWFFCAGLAISLLCMGTLTSTSFIIDSSNHLSNTRPRRVRETKHPQTKPARHSSCGRTGHPPLTTGPELE